MWERGTELVLQCVTAKHSKVFWMIFPASRNGQGWSGFMQWVHRASFEGIVMSNCPKNHDLLKILPKILSNPVLSACALEIVPFNSVWMAKFNASLGFSQKNLWEREKTHDIGPVCYMTEITIRVSMSQKTQQRTLGWNLQVMSACSVHTSHKGGSWGCYLCHSLPYNCSKTTTWGEATGMVYTHNPITIPNNKKRVGILNKEREGQKGWQHENDHWSYVTIMIRGPFFLTTDCDPWPIADYPALPMPFRLLVSL